MQAALLVTPELPSLALWPSHCAFGVSMPHTVGGPQPLEARQGRALQRYGSGGERLVAGCIPIRVTTAKDGSSLVEVLLLTSKSTGSGLVFPKGGWESDETVEAAAARETVEEAGVRGQLETPMLGCFSFGSKGSTCLAHVFAMRVVEELESWPENYRSRRWVPIAEAGALCRHEWMRQALCIWLQRSGLQQGVNGNGR